MNKGRRCRPCLHRTVWPRLRGGILGLLLHRNGHAKAAARQPDGDLADVLSPEIWRIRVARRASEYARAKSLTQHGGNCHGRSGDRTNIVAIPAGGGAP
jgi:hypothetical protein